MAVNVAYLHKIIVNDQCYNKSQAVAKCTKKTNYNYNNINNNKEYGQQKLKPYKKEEIIQQIKKKKINKITKNLEAK